MKMKKYAAMALAAAMLMGLSACGGGSDTSSTGGSAATSAGTSASTSTGGGVDTSNAEYRLVIGSTIQDDSASGIALLDYFKPYIEENSNGRIAVEVQNNSVLGGDRELYEALQLNTVQASFGPMSTLANFEPNYQVCDFPFLFTTKEQAYEALDGEFGSKLAENLPNVGMRLLAYGENAFRNISNSTRPIETIDDLAGLKIRVMESPVNIATYEALGCTPTPMAFNELYTGLQQGTVDGQDNGVVLTYTSRLYEVQSYYSFIGQIYAPNAIVVSEAFWQTLPEDLQQVVLDGSLYAMENQRELNTQMEDELLQEMVDAGYLEVNYVEGEALEAFKEATLPVWEQFKEEIDPEIYDMAVAIRDSADSASGSTTDGASSADASSSAQA